MESCLAQTGFVDVSVVQLIAGRSLIRARKPE
jgi:hypothetical protein